MKPKPNHSSAERINFRSQDGLVEIVTKKATARRYPPHEYPVVCLHLKPRAGTRVQLLFNADGSVDCMLTHEEMIALCRALNAADPKAGYRWNNIPAKCAARKAYWDRINAQRWKQN